MIKLRALLPGAWLATVLAMLLLLLWQLPQQQWRSSIAGLLPAAAEPWQQQLLEQVNSSRQISLALTGVPIAQLRQAASTLLENSAEVQWHQPGKLLSTLQQHYQQHQSLLISDKAFRLLQQADYQPLVDAALQQLYSPVPLLDGALAQDPLLLTQQYISAQGREGVIPKANWLESRDGKAVILYGEIGVDPFDRIPAMQLVQTLEQQLDALQLSQPQLQLARSGVVFHAVHAAANASFEMQFYGGMSVVAILLLLWFSFRSLRPVWLATLVLLPAVICGLALLVLSFSQVHVLSMVFATTLIGLAVDYSFHAMLAANQGRLVFQAMLPSLALSLLTTVLGYLVLLLLPFALLQQVAVFMLAGLTAAFLSVWLWLPRWLTPGRMQNNRCLLNACSSVSQRLDKLQAHRVWYAAVPVAALLLAALVVSGRFSDDVRLFNQSPASLLQQEAQVRALGAQQWDSRFLVVLASNSQQALQAEQQLQLSLQQWQRQGWLTSWQSVSQQLPSVQHQAEGQQLLQLAYQSEPVRRYLIELGLSAPAPRSDWLLPDSFPSPVVQQLIKLDNYSAAIVLLSQVTQVAELQQAVQQLPGVYMLDPIADTNASLSALRSQLMIWLAVALALSIAVLAWRRGLKAALASGLMLLIATSAALLVSLALQQQLNVFNLIAAILVLALALDYAVFFTSALHKAEVIQAVALSAATSCLAFGMLSFSQTPAVASFGITVFCGVALSALLAPLLSVIRAKELNSGGTL